MTTPKAGTQQYILCMVLKERYDQDQKWGEQHHPDVHLGKVGTSREAAEDWKFRNDQRVKDGTLSWDGILLEEVYEAVSETDPRKRIDELVQVAAVAVCWIEDILSRLGGGEQIALFEVK